MRYARGGRYYQSHPPPGGPDLQATDGLDGLLINGREVGAAHRAAARRELARLRQREAYADFLGLVLE